MFSILSSKNIYIDLCTILHVCKNHTFFKHLQLYTCIGSKLCTEPISISILFVRAANSKALA